MNLASSPVRPRSRNLNISSSSSRRGNFSACLIPVSGEKRCHKINALVFLRQCSGGKNFCSHSIQLKYGNCQFSKKKILPKTKTHYKNRKNMKLIVFYKKYAENSVCQILYPLNSRCICEIELRQHPIISRKKSDRNLQNTFEYLQSGGISLESLEYRVY